MQVAEEADWGLPGGKKQAYCPEIAMAGEESEEQHIDQRQRCLCEEIEYCARPGRRVGIWYG